MNSKQTEADYVPYGPEWEKEMSKFPKLQLIKMLGKAYQEKKELKQSLPSNPVGDVEEMDRVIKFLALELPEPVWNDVNKKWQGFKSGYAAAPQKGMRWVKASERMPEDLKRNYIVRQMGNSRSVRSVWWEHIHGNVEGSLKLPLYHIEWLDESPSPSEAGDGWDDEDWIKFIQWYAGMNRSSVLQGINQYKSQTPDQ